MKILHIVVFVWVVLNTQFALLAFSTDKGPVTPEACAKALQEKAPQNLDKSVDQAITDRTKVLREENRFILVDRSGQATVDIIAGIEKEFARPILLDIRRNVERYIKEIEDKWVKAYRQEIDAWVIEKRSENEIISKRQREVVTRLREAAADKSSPFTQETLAIEFQKAGIPNLYQIEFDERGLPKLALFQKFHEAGLAVMDRFRQNKKNARKSSGRIPAPDLVDVPAESEKLRVAEAAELLKQLSQMIIQTTKARYIDLLSDRSNSVVDEAEDWLAANYTSFSWEWKQRAIQGLFEIVGELVVELDRNFPLTLESNQKIKEQILASVGVAQFPSDSRATILGVIINKDGKPELRLTGDEKVVVYFEPEIATNVMEPIDGPIPVADGIDLDFLHGEGTTKSNVASLRSLYKNLIRNGYNPMGIDLPMAGIGMPITGYFKTVAYLEKYRLWRAKRSKPLSNGAKRPQEGLGRSMGSEKLVGHALLMNGWDAYKLMSFSNPYTIKPQTVNVLRQRDNGTIKGVIPESLDNAVDFAMDMLRTLEAAKAENPTAFELTGDDMLFWQGDGDEDACKDENGNYVCPIKDLHRFLNEYAPLGHVIPFNNRLLKHLEKIKDIDKIDPETHEGTHFILSNLSNISSEEGKKKYPGVPEEDLPKLQDQFVKAMASSVGFHDYLADSRSLVPEMQRKKKVWSDYRDLVCGRDAEGRPVKFMDKFIQKLGLTYQDLEKVQPGDHSIAGRVKWVIEFWKAETARVEAIYASKGMLAQ